MNMYLLSSFPNMIIDSVIVGSVVGELVGKWSVVGCRLVGGLVVRGFNKTPEKQVWGCDFACVHWSIDRGLFCYSNFSFFYVDDKGKRNLIARSIYSNL